MLLRDFVGEAVAEIERGGVEAFAPAPVGLRDAPGRRGSDGHNLEAETVDDAGLPRRRHCVEPRR